MQKELSTDISDKNIKENGEDFMFLFLALCIFTPREKFNEIINGLKNKENLYDERGELNKWGK